MSAGPITKIWLFSLKEGHHATDSDFEQLWREILAHTASYTRQVAQSTPGDNHVLYQSDQAPAQLAMITGYPSLESNLDADRIYAATYMERMFRLVQHQRLFLLNVDIHRLPLSSGAISLSTADQAPGPGAPGAGAWDCYQPPTKPGQQASRDQARPTWVHVCASEAPMPPPAAERWQLRKIMGSP